MARKDKTHSLFDDEGVLPVVRLPQSDSRTDLVPTDHNKAQVEGATDPAARPARSNNDIASSTKQFLDFAKEPHHIVVNIPSFGRYSEFAQPVLAGDTSHRRYSPPSPSSFTSSRVLTGGRGPRKLAKPRLTTRTPHLVKLSTHSPSTRFKVNPSSKPRLVHLDKRKVSTQLKHREFNHTAAVTSRLGAGGSSLPSATGPMGAENTTAGSSSPRGSSGRGDPRNVVMPKSRAGFEQTQLAGEGAQITLTNNIYSTVTSPDPNQPSHTRASSSQLWNDFASKTSGQPPDQAPSRSPHKDAGNQELTRNMTRHALAPAHRPRATYQRSSGGPIARRWDDWASWPEVQVKIFGLTANITTSDLWKSFSKEGTVVTIELFEDSTGARDGKAMVRFSPPPAKSFWLAQSFPVYGHGTGVVYVRLELQQPRPSHGIKSPVDDRVIYPEVMMMNVESVDFGVMYEPETLMSMHTVYPTASTNIQFRQSMRYKEIIVEMTLEISDPESTSHSHSRAAKYDRIEVIRFKIPFSQLEVIHQMQWGRDKVELLISLETPPRFYRKVSEASTHDSGRYWTEQDAWFRQTDIVLDPASLKSASLTLKKTKPIIDLGRWTTYRITLDMSRNDRRLFDRMCQALRDHNIDLKPFRNFKLIKDREPAVWEFIDEPLTTRTKARHVLEELTQDMVPQLSFPVRYQLEVCISQGFLNEHNLTRDFVTSLIRTDETRAQDLLEYVANQKKRIWDPMQVFSMKVVKGAALRSRIPSYCVYTRSATVTPTTVYYNTPTVDTSNRVIRQYAEYADRFLRVRFTDEKFQARINPTDKDTMNEVFTRVKRTMVNGITIGDRRYEFLAFGNAQFREHGAYFFAPIGDHVTASQIRQWMGSFTHIKVIAKHAARLGQCFSTTRAINFAKAKIQEIDDVKRNGYTFSDGVGKISPMLATITASELGIMTPVPPSVFQFRLGGCKGVLAVSHDALQREIHIRESQYKFPAMHEGLEIIRWSQMTSANLNRQLILVLSALGVADDVFVKKLRDQLANLEQAMTDQKVALGLLQKDIDPNQMTLCLAGMVIDGFQQTQEPFLTSLLHLWRAWSIKYLKEKARLSIGNGALLLGCLDETGILKGHSNSARLEVATTMEEKVALLPEVFVQITEGLDKQPRIIIGPMLVARNPSLHPGDIRVVCGVDVPGLRHLRDAVVFPQTGDRDIPGMCSGGDLDGDDFLVMWDKDLLPKEWNHEPMDYTSPHAVELERNVTIDDLTSFFVTYMKNNTLPSIATAHVAQADFLDDGVKSDKCLKLAALHSMAVDYVKSGTPARMTSDLRPRKWPHFMEKEHKPAEQIYHSKKVLGQLYDQVDRVDFVPTFDKPFDKRILSSYMVSPEMLKDAAEVKLRYDAAMRRIMAQHEIKTEFEVWSTFVMQHSNDFRDYKFHEEIGNLSQSLKDQFRDECRQKVSTEDFEDVLRFVAAMYQVTAQETDLALSECRQMVMVGGVETPLRKMVPSSMPLMSFPWLFPHYLGQIANGNFSVSDAVVPIALQGQTKRTPPKKQPVDPEVRNMVLETAEGTTHRGENLILFDDWVDVNMDSHEQKVGLEAGPIPSLAGSVSDANGSSVHDLLSHELSFEESYPGNRENGRLRSTASSSQSLSNSADIDRFGMRPSQLFRHAEADIGTLSRVLTPTSSESTSQGVQVSLDGKGTPKHSTAGDSDYSSHDNRSNNLLGPIEAAGRKAENEATPIMKPRVIGVKTADSRANREKAGSMVEEDGLEVNEDNDDEVEEEVEVHLETKPSYIDRLSLLDID